MKVVSKTEEVRRRFNKSGLKCSRSNFNRLVHNPVYAGKLRIAATIEEPEEIVDGIHEPIIDMNTFLQVQEILDERKPKTTKKIKANDSFPLRGFLTCAQCGSTLTASASRGRLGGRYEYYHCSKGCSERLRAHQVNDDFVKLFRNISNSETVMELYSDVLHNLFKASDKQRKEMQEVIQAKIDRNVEKINEKMDEWTDKKIDVTEYREVKARYEKINADLMREKAKLQCISSNRQYLRGVVEYLKTLDRAYEKANTENKRLMVGSIFAGKLTYEKNGFRTPEYTELVAFISQENSELEEIKSGLNHKNAIQSRWVVPTGIEPVSKV
jgi:site-specific DNA recombinase